MASMSSSDVLLKIKETSCAAVAIYDHLQLGKTWNLPGKHANNAVLSPGVTTVAIRIISLLSALSPMIRKSARKLRKLGKIHKALREVKVAKDVEVKIAAEGVQAVGLVLVGSVLLGTVQQKATLLE